MDFLSSGVKGLRPTYVKQNPAPYNKSPITTTIRVMYTRVLQAYNDIVRYLEYILLCKALKSSSLSGCYRTVSQGGGHSRGSTGDSRKHSKLMTMDGNDSSNPRKASDMEKKLAIMWNRKEPTLWQI